MIFEDDLTTSEDVSYKDFQSLPVQDLFCQTQAHCQYFWLLKLENLGEVKSLKSTFLFGKGFS